MFGQTFDDLARIAPAEPLLLRATPLIGPLGSAGRSGRPEVFADVIKIAQKVSLFPEDLVALQTNPGSAISHGVDAGV